MLHTELYSAADPADFLSQSDNYYGTSYTESEKNGCRGEEDGSQYGEFDN